MATGKTVASLQAFLELPGALPYFPTVDILRSVSHVLAALFNDRAKFQRQWDNPSAPGTRWQGEWISQANGHRGELKCLLTAAKPGEYDAAFHAVYARFLRVAYHVALHGREIGGKVKLQGQADLGKLAGGIYHYEGEMDETTFHCNYRCAYDHGAFQMTAWRR